MNPDTTIVFVGADIIVCSGQFGCVEAGMVQDNFGGSSICRTSQAEATVLKRDMTGYDTI